MKRGQVAGVMLTIMVTVATGCSKRGGSGSGSGRAYLRSVYNADALNLGVSSVEADDRGTQKYIAQRDKFEIVTSEPDLQKSWEAAVAFCGTIGCEVVSSNITTRADESVPSGNVILRVAPGDFVKLTAYLGGLGKTAQHTTERENKTAQVVDNEAKIKNLAAFRDNLRAMLGRPSATVRDLIEIQKQLADTQADLDSEAALEKRLTNETQKIAVEIDFRVEHQGGVGGISLIGRAIRQSGTILADSTADLITTITYFVPWILVIAFVIWLARKTWRRFRRRRGYRTTVTEV